MLYIMINYLRNLFIQSRGPIFHGLPVFWPQLASLVTPDTLLTSVMGLSSPLLFINATAPLSASGPSSCFQVGNFSNWSSKSSTLASLTCKIWLFEYFERRTELILEFFSHMGLISSRLKNMFLITISFLICCANIF